MSGPHDAVPRPRWAASRWTIVSGRGTSSGWWVAAASVRGAMVGRRDLQRLRRRRGAARRPSSSGQLQPADVGVAAVLLRPDVRDGLLGHRRLVDGRRARRAAGRGTSRAGRSRTSARPPARGRPRARCRRGQVGELATGWSTVSVDARSRRPAAGITICSWRDDDGRPPVVTSSTIDWTGARSAASERTPTSRRSRRSRPAAAQAAAIPPMRSLSVGARHRDSAGGAARSGWTDRVRRRRRAPSIGPSIGDLGPRRSGPRAERDLERAISDAGRGPRPTRGRPPAGGQPGLAGLVQVVRDALERHRRSSSPGPIDGRGYARRSPRPRRRSRPPSRSPEPRQVGEVRLVRDDERPGPRVEGDGHRRGERPVLPERRLRRPVRPDQAVGAEVAVVGLVAEVAAVGPAGRAVGQRLDEAVVPPLPDEAALQPGRRLDGVPVVGERAVASCPSRASTRT